MREVIKIKEWFYDKTQAAARAYNVFLDVTAESRNEIGSITADENGYLNCVAEVLDESEKAYKVHLESGAVVGSVKGWTTWVPKTVMIRA